MNVNSTWALALLPLFAAAAVAPAGCALLSRGAALEVSYYDPLPPKPASAMIPQTACVLSSGRIRASDALRREVAFRRSTYEVGYYEGRRWTELPDGYLVRALDRALFESGRCRRSESPNGVTLDATLIAFEEIQTPEAGRVVVHVLLQDDRTVLWDATIETQRPATVPAGGAGDSFAGVAQALGGALEDAAAQITQRVTELLFDRTAR